MDLLNELLNIQSVSGNESPMTRFLIQYVQKRNKTWKVRAELFFGEKFHDCVLLKFGNPRTAVFAHIDTIGFMTRYENQLIAIGGPEVEVGTKLVGEDRLGPVACRIKDSEDIIRHDFPRAIDRGTCLSFEQNVRIDGEFIQAAYLDNRLGIYNCLRLCEVITDGWIVFSTYEEHGGGSMPFLLRFIQDTAPINQALISDITWVTDGVVPQHGVVISLRDKMIPRKKFLDRIVALAEQSGIPFQLEVEANGGSDGREIQHSPYAIDWCFIGAAEDNVHSPNEIVALCDLDSMIALYQFLLAHL